MWNLAIHDSSCQSQANSGSLCGRDGYAFELFMWSIFTKIPTGKQKEFDQTVAFLSRTNQCRIFIVLVLLGMLSAANTAFAQKPFTIDFDKTRYSVRDDTAIVAKILLHPFPAKRIFSYGLLVEIEGANGIVGSGMITPAKQFNYNGPLDSPALSASSIGVAAVKGTSDFYKNALPPLVKKTLATFSLQPLPAGEYEIHLFPYRTLGDTEQLFVRGDLGVSDEQITFGEASIHVIQVPGTISLIGGVIQDSEDARLWIQTIRLTNTLTRTTNGVRIFIDNLPSTISVMNATGKAAKRIYLDYLQSLAPNQYVDLKIKFFPHDKKSTPSPTFTIEEIVPPEVPSPPGASEYIQPRLSFANGYNLIEFSSELGAKYSIQYSSDLLNWKTAQPIIMGTGNRVQWMDTGPPRTESVASEETVRFYRVSLLPG